MNLINKILALATIIGEKTITLFSTLCSILSRLFKGSKLFNRKNIQQKSLFKHKTTYFALIVILFFGPFVYLLTRNPKQAEAEWFNDNWMYRKKVEITNSGTDQTDFQVDFTIDTATLISNGKMQSDCDDIRITDLNGKVIPHWIEENNPGCNDASTKIWTKIPNIETTGATIYVYYGNPSTTNTENGDNVFEFFDDFSGDLNNWTIECGPWAVNSGVLELSTNSNSRNRIVVGDSSWDDYITEVRLKYLNSNEEGGILTRVSADHSDNYENGLRGRTADDAPIWIRTGNSGCSLGSASSITAPALSWSVATDTWYNMKAVTHGSTHEIYVNGTQETSGTNSTLSTGKVGLWSYQTEAHFDNFRIRKYAATEPSAGSPSTEEQSPEPVAYWKFDEGYGTTIYDSTQSDLNGNFSDSPEWQSRDMCISDKCLKFDGSNDSISITDSNGLTKQGETTLSLWFKFPSNYDSSNWDGVLQPAGAGYSSGWRLLHRKDHGSLDLDWQINTDNGSAGPEYVLDTINYGTLEGDIWYHLSLVHSDTNAYLYLNGVQVDSTSISGPILYSSGTSITIGEAQNNFEGFLDEIKIYPYARTAEEIKADYVAQSSQGSSAVLGAKEPQYLSEGLVGYWKMDESSWTNDCSTATVLDSSGNDIDGTSCPAPTGPTGGTAGKFGNAGDFDGTNYATLGNNDSFNYTETDSFSVVSWVKLDGVQPDSFGGNTYASLVGKGGLAGSNPGFILYSYNETAAVQIRDSDDNISKITDAYDLNDSTWHLIVATVDRNTESLSIYVDGEFQDSTDTSNIVSLENNDQQAHLGTRYDSDMDNRNFYLDGKIDEVRIYNRALSHKEVRDLYNWAPGPVAYWNFNEGSGTTTAYDQTPYNNNATLNNMSESDWVPGKYGKALNYDGSTGHGVFLMDHSTANTYQNNSSNFSMNFWFKAYTNTDGGSSTRIISRDCSDYFCILTDLANGQDELLFYYSNTENSGWQTINDITQWHHVAANWDYENSNFQWYLDGTLIYEDSSLTTLDTSSRPIVLGGNTEGDGDISGQEFKGIIDDVRFYNYTRTSKQIVEDMNAGHPIVGSPVGSQVGYWKFDEGYGTTINDTGPNTINGTLSSSTSWTTQARFNHGLKFDGDDYISFSDDSELNFTDSPFSITFWAKTDGNNGTNSRVISRGTYDSEGYEIFIDENSFEFRTYDGSPHSSSVTLTDAQNWHHYTVVKEAGSQTYMYIDGELKSNNTNHVNPVSHSGSLEIGRYGGNYYFNGSLDEVKFYNSALTEDEIKLDYNQGKSTVMGASGTESDGTTPSFASARTYCLPGDTSSCSPPIAEWKFDEKTGTDANDTSGNGNTGTLTNMESSDWKSAAHCKQGACLEFDGESGNNEGVDIPAFDTPTSAISVSAWINPTTITGDNRQWLVKDNGGGFRSFIHASTAEISWNIAGNEMWSNDNLTENNWYFVTFTFDPSTNEQKIYLNGSLDNSVTNTGTITNDGNAMSIGYDSYHNYDWFNGFIDTVKIYDYALTQEQIAWNYNHGKPVAHWRFDEGEGTTAYDSSGNENNGTLTNMDPSTDYVTGKINTALDFDGNNDYVSLPNNLITAGDPFSVSLWANLNNDTHRLFTLRGDMDFMIQVNTSETVNVYTGTNWRNMGSISEGTWDHITVIFDGTTFKTFINGKETGTYNETPPSETKNNSIGIAGWDLSNDPTNGKIDDVRLYNYALTNKQVQNLYNQGSAIRFTGND
jgi:hypothetical protein